MSEQKETPKLKLPDAMLTPESQAATTQMVTAAVREALSSIMKNVVGPILQNMQNNALTPERISQIEEARRQPSEAQKSREARERLLTKQEADENRKNREAVQAGCAHKYPSGASSVQVVHNYPDRQPRGICAICQIFLHPRQWVIDPPDAQHPRGTPRIEEASRLYGLVLERESQVGI